MLDGQAGAGKSLSGYLMDMSDGDFQVMVAQGNMTALLNIQQMLQGTYNHTVQIKDALIQSILNEPGDSWATSDTIAKLHVISMKIETRFLQVKEALKHRDLTTDSAYKQAAALNMHRDI